ncbi:MAG: hypothetical protein ACOC3V_01100 [bacterium]
METKFENFKNKKYKIICIKSTGKDESIEVQKFLFSLGVKWDVRGEEFDVLYITNNNSTEIYFYVLLDEKHLFYSLNRIDNNFYLKKENRPDKIFTLADKLEIETIIRYGYNKPMYEPKKIYR